MDEAGQDVAGEHDEQNDSDDNIDAYEALASNFGESGSEETSSDDSCDSNEIQKSKKIRITKATPPEPTEISAYEKDRNARVAERQAQEMDLFGFVVMCNSVETVFVIEHSHNLFKWKQPRIHNNIH